MRTEYRNALPTLLLSFIVGVGLGMALGFAFGVLLAIWSSIRYPSPLPVRAVLSALALGIDALFVWRFDLDPTLALIALPLALISVWIGVRLVLIRGR